MFEKHVVLDRMGGKVPDLNRHRMKITEPEISIEQSCQLVVDAFSCFDKKLGDYAAEVLADPARRIFTKVEPGKAVGCCSLPGQEDNNSHSIIHYQYDETISDAVYIAHELGHALSGDISGKVFRKSTCGRYRPFLRSFFSTIIWSIIRMRN